MDSPKNVKDNVSVEDTTSNPKTSVSVKNEAADTTNMLPANSLKSGVKSTDEKKATSRLKKWKKRMRFQPKNVTLDSEVKHEYYKELLPDPKDDTFELPRAVPVAEYVEEAKKEVKAMLAAIKQHSGSKTALQTLPKHMRRRAASHNIKRLPIRLRELASQQMVQPTESSKTGEKVCRRKRRKKVGLQNEYAKRAGKQGWLETHLWHSKRFHMTENSDTHYRDWSHRVAIHPNDKSFRACYRAVSKHCLIQDISYLHCVELSGFPTNLKTIFEKIVRKHDLSCVFDAAVLSGKSEVEVLMCDVDNKVIGPMRIIWQPQTEDCQDAKHIVWCWIHPAAYKQALKELEPLSTAHSVTISDRTENLNRLQFTGPKSSVTLLSTLLPIKVCGDPTPVKAADHLSAKLSSWIVDRKNEVEKQQQNFCSTLLDCHRCYFHESHKQTTARARHGAVLSVLVNDPRLTLPLQKTKPTLKSTLSKEPLLDTFAVENLGKSLEVLPSSPIWDDEILEEVASSRLPDHVTSTRKNEAKLTLGEERTKALDCLATPVPVLLIRRSGIASHTKKQGVEKDIEGTGEGTDGPAGRSVHGGPPDNFGSGWDVILPKKWATAFWIPFVYHTARAGGLRESEHSYLECKTPFFPRDFPETDAGRKWWTAEMETNLRQHYSKPPAKRVNFSVMATPFPFCPDWEHVFLPLDGERVSKSGASPQPQQPVASKGELVITENQNLATSFTGVTRKRSATSSGDDVIPIKKARDNGDVTRLTVLRDKNRVATLRSLLTSGDFDNAISLLESLTQRTLVCVQITPINRGTPAPQAMLCAPSSDDFIELRREFEDLNGEGLKSCSGPIEPKHWDPFRKERKLETKEAKKRRKRKKKDEHAPLQSTNQKPHKFNVLPTRPIIGFVTSGDFLFSYASGGGVGFVTVGHLVALLKEQFKNSWLMEEFAKCARPPLALMRLTDSTQYRFASLIPTS